MDIFNENAEIKSVNSADRSYLRFLNLTDRTIEIIWINFTGQYVRYQLIRKGQFVDINTFKTHPWMAIDVHTKDRMHIGKKFVFYPMTYKEHQLNHNLKQEENTNLISPVNTEKRILISITLPVYSLRYFSLLAVRHFFKGPDEVDALNLPKPIMEDLKKTISLRNRLLTVPIITIA